jgi:serine/threonine protein kinase
MASDLILGSSERLISWTGITYVRLAELGSGGNGRVFRMMATTGPFKGVQFAVKLFRRVDRPEWLANFYCEVNFLRSCQHPAILRVFDEGLYQVGRDSFPFVVTELMPQTLQDVLRSGLPLRDKLACALQLLSALDYLARRDPPVVHRDIKPTNVFLKGPSAILGDFGLLKFPALAPEGEESNGPGMPRAYRTPDLVDYLKTGRPPSHKSDVYQLALVLAELLLGQNPQRPFSGRDFSCPIELVPLPKIGESVVDVFVAPILQEMMADEPHKRPDAGDVCGRFQSLYLRIAQQSTELGLTAPST